MDMIERVARALASDMEEGFPRFTQQRWDQMTALARAAYRQRARVAIEAMVEPTNGMLGEAAKAMSPGKRPTQEFVSVKEKHKIRYQAMIRSALDDRDSTSPPETEQ